MLTSAIVHDRRRRARCRRVRRSGRGHRCSPAIANLASGIGRMAFDSIVQRDAPDANQGRAFAQFETRFQLSWAVAGVIPVLFTFPGRAAFLTVGLIGVLAVVLYIPVVAARSAAWRASRSGLLADQFEAGDPQARRVDLGRGRQGVRTGEKRAEPGFADPIDDTGDERSCRAAPGGGSAAGRAAARCRRRRRCDRHGDAGPPRRCAARRRR